MGNVNVAGSPAPAARIARRPVLLVAGLLLVVAVAAYRNTLTAPFVLDDGGSVTDNATIRHLWPLWPALSPPGGGLTVSGRPLMNLSLALNYAISGDAVWSYHLLNLVVHLLAGCTLFGLVRRTLGRPPLRSRFGAVQLPAAAAIAGLWLVHPLQTEAVTYVSQRTESLAGLFILLTLYAFVRSLESARPGPWRALTVAACAFGMTTKEITATAPLLVLLYDRAFEGGSFRRAWSLRRFLYLALASTWLIVVALVAGTGWTRGGTAGFDVGVPAAAYWETQFEAVTRYLALALWPHPLIFDHGTFSSTIGQAAPYALVIVPLATATLVALWRWPAAGFLGAWFFVILAPTSLVPGTIQMIVEHRMYLPLAAVVTLGVTGLYAALGRASLLIWPVAVVAMGWLTFERNQTYGSDLALWRDTVAKVPGNARARYSLGIAFSERGDYVNAVAEGEAALAVPDRASYAAKAYFVENKLGYDLTRLGRMNDAVAHYEAALRQNPIYAVAHLNLARALVALDRYPEAILHFEAALQRHFGGAAAEVQLSDALMHEGRTDEAAAALRVVLQLKPDWAPGWNNLGYALLLGGRLEASIGAYREAVRLDPRYAAAWMGLGYALIRAGRPAEAIAPCTEAVKLQPASADASNTLGIAQAQSGRNAEAVASFEQALRRNGRAADVHNNLANALAGLGRANDAIQQYRAALQCDPDYAPAHRNLGELLQRLGRSAEAAEQLATAARLESARP